ncbi:MAG: hypothetical protein JWO04_1482 [Gammaproteobacteria bacterium]|nr:hypothetical protein [Gammaproteobacteria bacterium]
MTTQQSLRLDLGSRVEIEKLLTDERADQTIAKCNEQAQTERDFLFLQFNQRFAVLNMAGSARVLGDFDKQPDAWDYYTFNDFKSLYGNLTYMVQEENQYGKITTKFKHMADEWLAHKDRREYLDGLVFDPSNSHKQT